jgi:hypothetical protein
MWMCSECGFKSADAPLIRVVRTARQLFSHDVICDSLSFKLFNCSEKAEGRCFFREYGLSWASAK